MAESVRTFPPTFPENAEKPFQRYGVAVLAVVVATAGRALLSPFLGLEVPYILFFPAILVSGWTGGFGPGFLATLLSALSALFFFIAPARSFEIRGGRQVALVLLFLAVGTGMSLIAGALQRARLRIAAAARDLRKREEELARAAAEAAESEMRFRVTADDAPVMIWMAGTDMLCDWFNQGWLQFTGRSLHQEAGHGWAEGVHPDDRDRCMEVYASSFAARQPFAMEYRLRRHDGVYRWLLDRGRPRHAPSGGFEGYIGSCVDITEIKEGEAARERLLAATGEALSRAEEASRSKDEFLATVSHELRTPLNSMMGWAQLLALGSEPEKVERGLQAIVRNAKQQAQLIDDLLDVSRIVSGRMRLDVRAIDLARVIEAAAEAVRPAAEAKQIRLRTLLDPKAGPVAGDPDRLQQVTWNLLANAIKFTPRGGHVEARLERVNSHVEILVADSGIGIGPEFLPHVFDRFRQLDSSTTRTHGGLGLGLSIVRHLVELHGGTVEARSPGEGQGATFIVRLPLAVAYTRAGDDLRVHPTADPGVPGDDPELDLSGIRVLVVEDEAEAREALGEILERCRAQVLAVESAAAALAALEGFRPDVLLSDIGMPEQDGYSLIQHIRKLPPERGGTVPAAALTAFARGEDRRRALVAGFQNHLAKPVDIGELAAVVASLARNPASGPRPPWRPE